MAYLFDVDRTRIIGHIASIYSENELDIISTCAEKAQVQIEGKRNVKRTIRYYNLDMIISVGYRVKSQRGIIFRQWANKVLKQYLIDGYGINNKKMLANTLDIETQDLKNIIDLYTNALTLLDNYDH